MTLLIFYTVDALHMHFWIPFVKIYSWAFLTRHERYARQFLASVQGLLDTKYYFQKGGLLMVEHKRKNGNVHKVSRCLMSIRTCSDLPSSILELLRVKVSHNRLLNQKRRVAACQAMERCDAVVVQRNVVYLLNFCFISLLTVRWRHKFCRTYV